MRISKTGVNRLFKYAGGGPGTLCEPMEPRQLLAADLVATGLSVAPGQINPDDDLNVTVDIANHGDADAGAFRMQLRLSKNDTFGDSDDIILGRIGRPAGLGAGESASMTRTFSLPEEVDAGEYFLGVRMDSLGRVPEYNENNNVTVTDDTALTVGNSQAGGDIEIRGRTLIIADGDTTPSTTDGTNFGALRIDGPTRLRTYTIFNRGDSTLDINDISIGGADASNFEVVDQSDDSVAPGESATFTVRFDPSTVGVKNAVVTVSSSDPDEADYDFAISGRGRVRTGPPDIAVIGLSNISDGDDVASPSDGTHFGVATVGESIEREFTIRNNGTGNLVLNTPFVTISGQNADRFQIVDMPSDLMLAPGESTTFIVRFNATSPGTKKATINIFSNDPDEGTFNFQIRGRGHP